MAWRSCAAGIVPYINASIILQLLATTYPSLKKLQREEGKAGKDKYEQYQKYRKPPRPVQPAAPSSLPPCA